MNRLNLITVRQQFASFGLAAAVTVAVLASMGQLANGYSADALQAARAGEAASVAAVQTVVVIGKRAA